MKERGIIFSGEMVRAILDGRKSQTRRIVKWPTWIGDREFAARVLGGDCKIGEFKDGRPIRSFGCPYGAEGDRLWVRETWCHGLGGVYYRASESPFTSEPPKWKPAIHMPRWASRITLEITDVRVERAYEITTEDAEAEGYGHRVAPAVSFLDSWTDRYGDLATHEWVWAITFKRAHGAEMRGAA